MTPPPPEKKSGYMLISEDISRACYFILNNDSELKAYSYSTIADILEKDLFRIPSPVHPFIRYANLIKGGRKGCTTPA